MIALFDYKVWKILTDWLLGLRDDIRQKLHQQQIYSLEDAYELAIGAERYLEIIRRIKRLNDVNHRQHAHQQPINKMFAPWVFSSNVSKIQKPAHSHSQLK